MNRIIRINYLIFSNFNSIYNSFLAIKIDLIIKNNILIIINNIIIN